MSFSCPQVLDKFLSDYATVTTAGNSTDTILGKEILQQHQQLQQQQGETSPIRPAPQDGSELEPTNR